MRKLIEEWVYNDLSVVDPDIGYAPCPFAKKALKDGKLLVIECTELDDASRILEKTGYYNTYDKEDYINLILNRRRRRDDARS